MPKRAKNQSSRTTAVKEMVTVAFAEDMDLAKQYQQLLGEQASYDDFFDMMFDHDEQDESAFDRLDDFYGDDVDDF